ncbi:hypothetical protein I2F17_08125 [Acinetobacter sp. B10A]|uniref:hypothetical protein n=1 Tax=Acinetobacter baretiae TaxID=2605383 RepID=UPI001B3C660D|nr:hypothetical protein [Acinetobacter baretiae]MBF7685784.1 hypothetical protein [Acinetobacter baretiae]
MQHMVFILKINIFFGDLSAIGQGVNIAEFAIFVFEKCSEKKLKFKGAFTVFQQLFSLKLLAFT